MKYVLQTLGSLLPSASLGRLENDDFVVILNLKNHDAAVTNATLIREQFTGRAFVSDRTGERLKQISVSIGAALLRETDDEVTWFERAQKLLLSAKHSGGNQAMVERTI